MAYGVKALVQVNNDANFPRTNLGAPFNFAGDFRIEYRIRNLPAPGFATAGSNQRIVWGHPDSPDNKVFALLTYTGDTVQFQLPTTPGDFASVVNNPAADGRELYVRLQYNFTTKAITCEAWYKDGTRVGSTITSATGTAIGNVANFALGTYFQGDLDWLRIYTSVVAYNSAKPSDTIPAAGACWANWEFENDLLDSSGNGRHLTRPSGAATFSDTPAGNIAMSRQPVGGFSGETLTVMPKVNVLDQGGAIDTSFTGNVSVALAGAGSLSGTTVIAAVAGVADWATVNNLVITGAGASQLVFSTAGRSPVSSASITTDATPTKELRVIQQPGGADAGSRMTTAFKVGVYDIATNTVDTTVRAVFLRIKSGPASTLAGSDSIVTYGGFATFRGISVQDAGTFTLEAYSPTIRPVTSAPLVVGAAVGTFYKGAELPRRFVDTTRPVQTGVLRTVGVGKTYSGATAIQDAMNAAAYGDTIELDDNNTFIQKAKVPEKPFVSTLGVFKWIILKTKTLPSAEGVRCKPADYAGGTIAKWKSPDGSPFLEFANRTGYWRFEGFEAPTPSANNQAGMITVFFDIGHLETVDMPTQLGHFVFDRLYLHRDDGGAMCRRGIYLNGQWNAVINCDIRGMVDTGSDSQAIITTNGSGPYKIDNCRLEGVSENFMSGGDSVWNEDLVAFDIQFTHNLCTKPIAWKGNTVYRDEKNLFELKQGHRVLVEYNVFENHWDAGISQIFAFNIKSVNQYGDAPFTGTRDVIIRRNVVRNVASFIRSAGHPQNEVEVLSRLVVTQNLVVNVNSATYNGDGYHFSTEFCYDTWHEHNTFVGAVGRPNTAWYLTDFMNRTVGLNNLHVADTLVTAAVNAGSPYLHDFFDVSKDPAADIRKNLFSGYAAGGAALNVANQAPATGNLFVDKAGGSAVDPGFTTWGIRATMDVAPIVDLLNAFKLTVGSAYHNAGTDGADIGVSEIDLMIANLTGVYEGTPGTYAPPATDLLNVIRQPAGAVAGSIWTTQPLVEVLDATTGLRKTSFTGPVTVSLLSGAGTLLGTTTVNAVAGLVTFATVGNTTAGVATVRFTGVALSPADSGAFTVTGAVVGGPAISALVIVRAPSAAKARQPFTVQPIVKAIHSDGSTATEFTGIITAFKRGGRGTLRGTLSMRAVAGVASWTDLQSTLSAPILIGFYTLEVDV